MTLTQNQKDKYGLLEWKDLVGVKQTKKLKLNEFNLGIPLIL